MSGDTKKDYRDHEFYILFADDQKFMLKNLERYFKDYFNVVGASSLDEAKNHLQEKKIAVVISDHQMADGQGIELLEYITETHSEIRRILITADRHENVVIDMMDKQLARSFVYKPTVKDQLHVVIAEQAEIYLDNQKQAVE